ncbi:hypothetical protein XANCAGTX0491_002787 [Xanthoria calcicola]
MFRQFFLLLPLLLQKADAQKKCYKYGGESAPDFPCNPEVETSACCGKGYICRTNLYCENNSTGAKRIGTCTDRDWNLDNHPACPFALNKVLHEEVSADFNYELNTTRCIDTKPQTLCPVNYFFNNPDNAASAYTSNDTCCGNSQGITEINYRNIEPLPKASADLSSYYALAGYTIPTDGIYKAAITSSTSTSSTSATAATGTTTSATTSPSAVSSPDPTPSPGLSTGAKAGIGVGAAAGILAVAGALIFLFMRRRKSLKNGQQQHAMSSDPQYDAVPQEPGPMQEHKTGYHGTSELAHEPAKMGELGSDKKVSEMAG